MNFFSFNRDKLDNADEQAATIRRELDSRMKQTESIQKVKMRKKYTFFISRFLIKRDASI
jgi:hypothetical protein